MTEKKKKIAVVELRIVVEQVTYHGNYFAAVMFA